MNAHFELVDHELAALEPKVVNELTRGQLSPTQRNAYERLLAAVDAAPIVALTGDPGMGKSTLLRLLARELDGEFLSIADIVEVVRMRDSLACAGSVLLAIEEAFERADVVLLDTLNVLTRYSARYWSGPMAIDVINGLVMASGKRLIMVGDGLQDETALGLTASRIHMVKLEGLDGGDYRTLLENHLSPASLSEVDIDLVWRHASSLNGHDLRNMAGLLGGKGPLSTDDVIACLDAHVLRSNVRMEEVEALSFASLPGSEAIAAKLETHIILPLENAKLARELDISPKRGVLLYGPPGTGKTSIGRALAHRMKGKLFLIDGSFGTEPPTVFFNRVRTVVQEAKENAPCVLFVDDADVLFGIEHIAGFSRYLLSLLDGVESESAGRVCLMMTAMNADRIPGAILRSGRVELWLETHHPEHEVRQAILQRWLGETNDELSDADLAHLADLTSGFTPADIRRIVSDARALQAMDKLRGRIVPSMAAALERAIVNLIDLREKMARNLKDESLRITSLSTASPYGDKDRAKGRAAKYAAGIGGLAESLSACAIKDW